MTEKRYYLENFKDFTVITLRLYDRKIKHKHYDWLTESHKIVDLLNDLADENEKLKHQNELLSDELEQCKAVINKKWSEYLQKKELKE